MPRNQIIPQMFDVRPVDESGDLDWEKIQKLEKVLELRADRIEDRLEKEVEKIREEIQKEPEIYFLGAKFSSDKIPIFHKSELIPRIKPGVQKFKKRVEENFEKFYYDEMETRRIKENFKFSDIFFPARFTFGFKPQKTAIYFAVICLAVALSVGIFSFGAKGLKMKGTVLGTSEEAYSDLNSAIQNIKERDYQSSSLAFSEAYEKFSESSKNLDEMGKVFIEISRFFPFSSQLSSGKNLVEAGKHIAIAGQSINKIMEATSSVENPFGKEENKNTSLLEIFQTTKKEIETVNQELKIVQEKVDGVNVSDLPEEKQKQFISLKQRLPQINQVTDDFLNNSEIFVDLLGGNGPRKYLFLFQNNQEMRATGGFIGSYGLLDISDGRIRSFFIDGIFNPDGQLQEKIIPPSPIQKISAAWSLHDSNWFPNFPTSAKEAIIFYEKTGGPTVDGVIALTPTIMQKLLEITGPIEMSEYGVTIDSNNFIEKTQYEVEVDYDKQENKPKKILSDLAPIILDKIFNTRDPKDIAKTVQVLSSGLAQKHILLYSQNEKMQEIISQERWSGEILETPRDYLSAINTNINGHKTDGVIGEEIIHSTEIQPDGSIIDTVTINRHHNGGNTDYEWWNKVNADYLRVYVPLGSKLLAAEGQTRETEKAPLDYKTLGFKKDPLVQKEEDGISVDEDSGTRIYEDAGKTVFANWTYVSPQETMTLKYKYLLPFKVDLSNREKPASSYSLLAQKQSGSIGSKFSSTIKFPDDYKIEWNFPDNLNKASSELKLDTTLETDKFIGIVFTKSETILND